MIAHQHVIPCCEQESPTGEHRDARDCPRALVYAMYAVYAVYAVDIV